MIRFPVVLAVIGILGQTANAQDLETPPDLSGHAGVGYSSNDRAKVIAHLKTVSDEQLKRILGDVLKLPDFRSRSGYEPCLSEIIRRGGAQWELFLKETFDALMNSKVVPYEGDDELELGSSFNLELLTALRRIKKQPDPLRVFIDEPKELTGTSAALPNLQVRIQNVDVEKTGIGFTLGGNYRGGRQERWRIIVQDEKGKVVPVRSRFSSNGGGIFQEGILEHEQVWETTLSLRSFIEVPDPGKYKLTVFYHNTQAIADSPSVDGLILSQSKTMLFKVERVSIAISKEDRETITKLVAEISGEKKLRIIAGTYGEWAHGLVSPKSPEGKLLSQGLKAAPIIIESLKKESSTNKKRAWLLGILYSLTGENDPRLGGVLGSYKYKEAGWQIWGGRSGESPSGGFSVGGVGSVWAGAIESEAQDKLVRAWDKWLQKVDVEE